MDYWLNPILSLFLEIEELCTEIHFRLNKSIFCTFNFVSIGLVRVAEEVGLNLLAPRKKITVILIGNHSAGKSSFINW
jgi:GTP-binding protein EngB required for normal cell division